MAARLISTVLRFVRKHISSLCCLLLLLLPPVHRVLLFFSPLLVSTALCVLALISWGPSSDGQNKSDKNIRMDEWAVVSGESECNESCSNAGNLEEISRSQELAEEQPDNPRERLQEGETAATSVNRASKPAEARTSEPDADLKNHDNEGLVEEGSAGVHPSVELSLYLRQAPLQKRSEEDGLVIPANGCDKSILQGVDAKLQKAVEKELAGLEASLWSYEGAMEERSGSRGVVGMEDGARKHHLLQGKSFVRKEEVLHEQQKAILRAYEPSGLREVASKA